MGPCDAARPRSQSRSAMTLSSSAEPLDSMKPPHFERFPQKHLDTGIVVVQFQ